MSKQKSVPLPSDNDDSIEKVRSSLRSELVAMELERLAEAVSSLASFLALEQFYKTARQEISETNKNPKLIKLLDHELPQWVSSEVFAAVDNGNLKHLQTYLDTEGFSANLIDQNLSGDSLLTRAIGRSSLEEDNREIIKTLIARGADVNAADGNGLSAFRAAFVTGKEDIIPLLSNVNWAEELHHAIVTENLPCVKFLIEQLKVDIETPDLRINNKLYHEGGIKEPILLTPLQQAALTGASQVFDYLVESGANAQAPAIFPSKREPLSLSELAKFGQNDQIMSAVSPQPELGKETDKKEGTSKIYQSASAVTHFGKSLRKTPSADPLFPAIETVNSNLSAALNLLNLGDCKLSSFAELDEAYKDIGPKIKACLSESKEKSGSTFKFVSDFIQSLDRNLPKWVANEAEQARAYGH